MQKEQKRSEGTRYEERAAEYLQKNGCKILARNQNYRVGEIDIIAESIEQGKVILIFVEVRKRDVRSKIEPEETLRNQKQRRLLKAIQLFLLSYRGRATQIRIDLIGFQSSAQIEKMVHRRDFLRIF